MVIVTDGKNVVRDLLCGETSNYIDEGGLGLTNTAPSEGDTQLNEDDHIMDACDVTTDWTISGSNSISVNTTTYVTSTGALNMIKSDGTSADMNIYKATIKTEGTGNTMKISVYVKDAAALAKLAAADCFEFRVGSDSTNYYWEKYAASDFAVGWNTISMVIADATEALSPDINELDYTWLQFSTVLATDTFAAGDLIIDNIVTSFASTNFGIEDTVTTLTYTRASKQVVFDFNISSAFGNSFTYAEFGLSSSGDSKLFNRQTFYDLTKAVTDEIQVSMAVLIL